MGFDGIADALVLNNINNTNILNGKRPKWLIVIVIIIMVITIYNIIVTPLIVTIIDSIEKYTAEKYTAEKYTAEKYGNGTGEWVFGKQNYFTDRKETFNGSMETLKAYDNRHYMVQRDLPDKETAADIMASLNSTIQQFINQLSKEYPDDERVLRLKYKYDPKNFGEGTPLNSNNETSYSIDKGRELVVCLREKKNPSRFHDKNTVMFVMIHELAHIASKSYGHNREFNTNFRWLLKSAIKYRHYKFVDYKLQPVNYCGLEITDTPL